MNARPLNDRVLIRCADEDKTTKAGILLPMADKHHDRGHVVAVGPGRRNEQGERELPIVVPGQHVIFQRYAGQEVLVGDEELRVVREDDIVAVIEA